MRRLFISTPDGDHVEGISTSRKYYLFELDSMDEQAHKDLTRRFVVYFDDKVILDKTLSFCNLTKKVKEEMGRNSKESIKYIKQVEDDISFNTELKEFLIKYDEQLGGFSTKPFSFSLDIYKMKRMFDCVYEKTGKQIFLELNNIVKEIENLYEYLLLEIGLNEEGFFEFMQNERNFKKVCEYMSTKLMSVDHRRIETAFTSIQEYYDMQDKLFKELSFYIPFNNCMDVQKKFVKDIYNEFYHKMFNSKPIESSEILKQEVILPVINRYIDNINGTLKKYNQKGG